jgi:hypothetical protein
MKEYWVSFRSAPPLGTNPFERHAAEEKRVAERLVKKSLTYSHMGIYLREWQGRQQPRTHSMLWRNRGGGTS